MLTWFALVLMVTPFNQKTWSERQADLDQVLEVLIQEDGKVNYPKLHANPALRAKLQTYADFVGELDPASPMKQEQKIAIYANAYNAFTLLGVDQAWPAKSVRDIRPLFGFFTKDLWRVGGRKVSLNDLEKKILRPLDPRIHFLINCASISCPALKNEAIDPAKIEMQMKLAALEFLQDTAKNQFDQGSWKLSKIFDWYIEDFGGKEGVVAFIRNLRPELEKPNKISYLDYNWNLNGPTN